MGAGYTQLYVHLVWTTWRRLPLLVGDLAGAVDAAVVRKCRELRCAPVAVGGMEDHMHLLARLHVSVAVAVLAGQVKGFACREAGRLESGSSLRWQRGYGAFTLGEADVPAVARYVLHQAQHHRAGGCIIPTWEPAILR